MSVEALRAVPVFNFVRMAYAAIILTKLYVSVRCPTSKIGKVLDRETLKIGIYVPAMIDRLSEAVGPMECRSPATFLGLLVRLQAWYENQETHEEFIEPIQLFCHDKFTPPTTNYSQDAKTVDGVCGYSFSELPQFRAAHEPAAPVETQFGKSDPFGEFFTPERKSMDGVPTTSTDSSAQTQTLLPGDDFTFDPAQVNFDFDPYLLPEEIDFLEAGASGWLTSMDLSGENSGVRGEREFEAYNSKFSG